LADTKAKKILATEAIKKFKKINHFSVTPNRSCLFWFFYPAIVMLLVKIELPSLTLTL